MPRQRGRDGKNMKVLFLGDVFAGVGRKTMAGLLPALRREHEPDFVLANCENAAGGQGITPETARELFDLGIDALTGGNHTWRHKEILDYLDREPRILRPANYPAGTPGRGSTVLDGGGKLRLGLLNLEGRVFMRPLLCPFRVADDAVARLLAQTPCLIVDFHAEATSEKRALGLYLDGRASAVLGTHTHVATADEQILEHGTAYITDVGMCGATNSVIGMKRETVTERFLTSRPNTFQAASGPGSLNGVLLQIDDLSGRALSIERIRRTAK